MSTRHYPSLREMVEVEGLCPICLTEMGQGPRYSCENGHEMCYRCRPYYHGCSTCFSPLNRVESPDEDRTEEMHPSMHFMSHQMSAMSMAVPFAPGMEFIENERRWGIPPFEGHPDLVQCRYSDYGCWIKIPEYLREFHETRCRFRRFIEEERLPPSEEEPEEDPEELVECKFGVYGCLVRMPRRRREVHAEKCNYKKYHKEEEFAEEPEEPEEEDPNSQVDCRWAEYGCRIRPKLYRREIHEEKCNYKLEECSFKENGCEETFVGARKFAHERICEFKD